MQLSEDLVIQASTIEAELQALRADVARVLGRRDAVLYAAWRETKDSKATARDLPRTITARTVQGAVLRLAPAADFHQLALIEPELTTTPQD